MNNCSLIGNLGRDWETKATSDGKTIAKNSIAIRKYNGESFWLPIVVIGKRAEAVSLYSGKGDKFGCSGQLDISEYEKDGVKKSFTQLFVSDFDFLGGKKDQPQHQSQQPQYQQQYQAPPQQQYQQPPQRQQQSYPPQQQFNVTNDPGFYQPPKDDGIPF